VSVRPAGQSTFGVKTEVKNLNSFRYLQRALEHEIARQTAVLESGGVVAGETRLFDAAAGRTVPMRSKEEAHDYRYFPEPDLPPLVVDESRIERLRLQLPELPEARRRRFVREYALPEYDADVLTQSMPLSDYFEAVARSAGSGKAASNWVMGELSRKMKEEGLDASQVPVPPERMADLIRLQESGTVSGPTAKDVFERMWETGKPAGDIVAAAGLEQVSDETLLSEMVRQVLDGNGRAVAQYREGKSAAFGFLVGQVMKASGGKANPRLVSDMLRKALEVP
jgi:aspartyl-tRNA(Asn)/glutamyl-tRNA(Gln) amidotransferase subunit B